MERQPQAAKTPKKGFKGKGKKKTAPVPAQAAPNSAETAHDNVMPGEIPDAPEESPGPQTYNTTLGGGGSAQPNPQPEAGPSGDAEQMGLQESMPFPAQVVNMQPQEEQEAAQEDAPEHVSDPVEEVTEPPNENVEEDVPVDAPVEQIPQSVTSSKTSVKPEEPERRESIELDPRDYGIEFDEENPSYDPPERDDVLPDLYRLMDSLEDGHSDLEPGAADPPSLFTRPEHVPNYKKITELKMEIEEDEIGAYVDDFEDGIKDDVLMIGSISLEEVQEEERRLRDEHIAYQEQEAAVERQRQQEMLLREEEAKKRVARNLKEKRKLIKRREDILQQKERLMMDRLHKAFRRSENQLVSTLEKRKGEIKTMYGDLTEADGHYGGSKGRRWKVDWDRTPQPIEVKLKCLRGVKDKLPRGRYVLMVSMYNRLGGHVMRWSKLKGQQWGGTTLPINHDGNFYNAEMKVEQNVYTVLPSKPGIRPGMVLVFELFLLRGEVVATDRVVGWGCFPIADDKFDVIEGKYKAPFLRGEMDTRIDKHEKVEELMSSDLDHWLCNVYFEIVKLPRYLAGQKEYEVELQFSSGMLSYPDRVNTGGEEYRDGEYPVPGSLPDLRSEGSQQISDEPSITMTQMLNSGTGSTGSTSSVDKKPDYKPYNDEVDTKKARISSASSDISQKSISSAVSLRKRRPMTTLGSRAVHKDKKVTIGDSDSDDYDEEDIYFVKKDDGFYPVKGKPGMYYKKYNNNPVDEYHRKLYTLMPKTPLLTTHKRKKHLTYLEQLEEHTFSVKVPFSDKGHLPSQSMEKLHYVRRQMMAELGLSEWRSREFWGMVIMFVLIFFMRMYLHYVGQWLFLQGQVIPITNFDFLPYTVNLLYQPTLLDTVQEAFVVLIGPFINIGFFILLVILSWVMQLVVGLFPDIGSKFVIVYGIEAFLDPFLILIVDCILLRFHNGGGIDPVADFAKLYWHFDNTQGSGLAGVFITVFLYAFTCFAAGAILYMYFLRLHNNGRMLDIYWRLHGDSDVFFVPYDLEISNQELRYIVKRAEQWRGEEGERRKVAVYDYIWEEETVEDRVWDEDDGLGERSAEKEYKKEITTHVSIHILHLDGLRELYRHFLRLPDGAIVEVFGDLSVAGIGKDLKEALNEQTQNIENLMGSQVSLNKIHGRQTAYTNAGFTLDEEDPTGKQSGPAALDTISQASSSAGSLPRKQPLPAV